MNSTHKQVCPTCGQSVNIRQIPFYGGMVSALWKVYNWCEEKGRHEFKKREVKHLMDDVVISVFHYWRWFGGLVYNPSGVKGDYGLNMERCEQFFSGKLTIPIEVWTNPLTKEISHTRTGTINDVPGLRQFLDENNNFVARYRSEPVQVGLDF